MRFWDSSALVSVLVQQAQTERSIELLKQDKQVVVSWLTYFECYSALCRLEREGLSRADLELANKLLDELNLSWVVIKQSTILAREIKRVLRIHNLKCADAIQLASALVARTKINEQIKFISFDQPLESAAIKEGLEK